MTTFMLLNRLKKYPIERISANNIAKLINYIMNRIYHAYKKLSRDSVSTSFRIDFVGKQRK
jgi:hypothetical protein